MLRSQSKSVAENPDFYPGSIGMHHGHTHSVECRTKRTRRGRGSLTPLLLSSSEFRGEAFLQPSPLQYGCTTVQHLCSDAAAAAGPRAPGRECCGCGCRAVRIGPGWGGLRGACRGGGQGLGLRDRQRLCLGIYAGDKI